MSTGCCYQTGATKEITGQATCPVLAEPSKRPPQSPRIDTTKPLWGVQS
jgi:hypothetical protein